MEGQVLWKGHSSDAFSGLSTRHIIPCQVDPFSEEDFPDPFPYKEYTRAKSCIILKREGIICESCLEVERHENVLQERKLAREAIPAKLKAPITKTSVNCVKLTLQAERLKCKQFEAEIIEMKKELSNKSLQATD